MSEKQIYEYEINMKRLEKYKFEVDFSKETIPDLLMDELMEVPGGEETGPTASMLIGAAVGNCLSASLIFCLEKKRIAIKGIKTKVILKRQRNEEGFWRISGINVELQPEVPEKKGNDYERCIEIFRNYCIASSSIESGIPIKVNIIR